MDTTNLNLQPQPIKEMEYDHIVSELKKDGEILESKQVRSIVFSAMEKMIRQISVQCCKHSLKPGEVKKIAQSVAIQNAIAPFIHEAFKN